MASRELSLKNRIIEPQDSNVLVPRMIPEAVLPHAGDGVKAGTVKVGHEVNVIVPHESPVLVLDNEHRRVGTIPAFSSARFTLVAFDPARWIMRLGEAAPGVEVVTTNEGEEVTTTSGEPVVTGRIG